MAQGVRIWGYLKREVADKLHHYASLRGVSTYQALSELIERGLMSFEREAGGGGKPVTQRDLEDLAEEWEEKFQKFLEESRERSSTPSQTKSSKGDTSGGDEAVPQLYRCKGKDCGYATEDVGDLVRHIIKEEVTGRVTPLESPVSEAEKPKRRHETPDEYVECPECEPELRKAYERHGWKVVKATEEKKEAEIV